MQWHAQCILIYSVCVIACVTIFSYVVRSPFKLMYACLITQQIFMCLNGLHQRSLTVYSGLFIQCERDIFDIFN